MFSTLFTVEISCETHPLAIVIRKIVHPPRLFQPPHLFKLLGNFQPPFDSGLKSMFILIFNDFQYCYDIANPLCEELTTLTNDKF